MMHTEILISAGARKYIGGTITESSGLDISGLDYKISLGSADRPGATWLTPDTSVSPGGNNWQRTVKYLVTSTTPAGVIPGTYYVWIKVTAAQEIDPLRIPGEVVIR
jgi:hypothetical protein